MSARLIDISEPVVPVVGHNVTPVVITKEVKLVEEKIHQHEEQHVQPIIERDIEQKVVKQVIQPVHETQVLPTQHATGVLAGENIVINNDRAIAPQFVPEAKVITGAVDVNIVQHAPIVEERFHKQIIEEVQPVLYRDVIQNKETLITQPIHERIVDAPVVIQETRTMIELNAPVHVAPAHVAPVHVAPVVPVVPVVAERPREVVPVVPVVAPVVVAPVVPVVHPVAPATAAFAVIPDGVPVVHDGKIVNAGLGGHDSGQAIRPVEAGLQTVGAIPGTVHTTGTGLAHGTHHAIPAKKANETHAERAERKRITKEIRKQESAEAKAQRKAAKASRNKAKRPHETSEERKIRKAEKKRLAAAHHH